MPQSNTTTTPSVFPPKPWLTPNFQMEIKVGQITKFDFKVKIIRVEVKIAFKLEV